MIHIISNITSPIDAEISKEICRCVHFIKKKQISICPWRDE